MRIVLVGIDGIGKKTLSEQLVNAPSSFVKTIHTATSLPLPEGFQDGRVDFCIFMVSMVSKKSLSSVLDSLPHLHPSMMLGRAAVVVTRADNTQHHAFSPSDLSEITNKFHTPIYYVDIKSPTSVAVLSSSLLTAAGISNGQRRGVTSLFLNTIDSAFVPNTTISGEIGSR